MRLASRWSILVSCLVAPVISSSAPLAYDDAAEPGYSSGWTSGSTGGYGFGVWDVYTNSPTPPTAAFLIGDSNLNGTGNGPGINTSGKAWGMQLGSIGNLNAYRFFDNVFEQGQVFTCEWDVVAATTVGAQHRIMLDSDAAGFFELAVQTTSPNYLLRLPDVANQINTGVAIDEGGVEVKMALTGIVGTSFSYDFSIRTLATNASYTRSGLTFAGTTSQTATQFTIDHRNTTTVGTKNSYLNRMRVDAVPEPAIAALLPTLLVLQRRRKTVTS